MLSPLLIPYRKKYLNVNSELLEREGSQEEISEELLDIELYNLLLLLVLIRTPSCGTILSRT